MKTEHDDFRRTWPGNDQGTSVGTRDDDVTRGRTEDLGVGEFDVASSETRA